MSNIQIKKLHEFHGHDAGIYCLERLDDHRFFSAGSDGLVVLWNLLSPDKREVVAKMQDTVYSMTYEGGFLYVGVNHEGIHQINPLMKKQINNVQTGNYQIFEIKKRKNKIWCLLASGELLIFDEHLHIVNHRKIADNRLRGLDFNGREVAIGTGDHVTKVFNETTMELTKDLKGHNNSIFTVRYHPSGKYLISAGRDAQLKVWDTSENYILRESIPAHLYTINNVAFNPNGKYFVTCSMDKSIKLWNAYNFKLLKVLDKHRYQGHSNSVNQLLWMEYQNLLVSCSDDRTISVWKINIEE